MFKIWHQVLQRNLSIPFLRVPMKQFLYIMYRSNTLLQRKTVHKMFTLTHPILFLMLVLQRKVMALPNPPKGSQTYQVWPLLNPPTGLCPPLPQLRELAFLMIVLVFWRIEFRLTLVVTPRLG